MADRALCCGIGPGAGRSDLQQACRSGERPFAGWLLSAFVASGEFAMSRLTTEFRADR